MDVWTQDRRTADGNAVMVTSHRKKRCRKGNLIEAHSLQMRSSRLGPADMEPRKSSSVWKKG